MVLQAYMVLWTMAATMLVARDALVPKITEPPLPLQYVYTNKDVDGKKVDFDITLKCGAVSNPDEIREWKRTTGSDLSAFVNPADGSLKLPGIFEGTSASVEGTEYWCYATTSIGKVRSTNGTLVFASFDVSKWKRAPTTLSAYKGESAVISCHFPPNAMPPPIVEWTVDETVIDLPTISYTAVLGDLEIKKARRSMDGKKYTCRIVNYRVTFSLPSSRTTILQVNDIRGTSIPPQFIKEPQDTVANEEDEVILECAAAPAINYAWYRNGESVTFTTSQLFGIGSLKIPNVKASDGGVYYCQAIGMHSNNASRTANLTVHVRPTITTVYDGNYIAYSGSPFSLNCVATGFPTPEIKWLANGSDNTYGGHLQVTKAVKYEDSGMYQCFAINSAGTDELVVRVIVRDPKIHSVSVEPQSYSILYGEVAKLECQTSGDPTPHIEWKLDGVLLNASASDAINITHSGDEEINSTRRSSLSYRIGDKGLGGVHVLTCRAVNVGGFKESNSSFTVNVITEIKPVQLAQSFVKGTTAILSCPTYGYPKVMHVWKKGGEAISLLKSRINQTSDGSLVVGQVDFSDEGRYTCTVSNIVKGQHHTESVTINVTVNVVPKVTKEDSQPPIFSDGIAVLTCEADAIPEPSVTWMKDSKTLDENGKFDVNTKWTGSIVTSVLQFNVEEDSDYGSYVCEIRNAVGTSRAVIDLAEANLNTTAEAPQVALTALEEFPLVAVTVPVLIAVVLILIVAVIVCCQKGRGSYEPTGQDSLGTFHLRTQGGGGELYAAPPDVIQHRGKFMAQQKQNETDGTDHHTYAIVGKKNLPTSETADDESSYPPYPGKPAPPYPGKVRAHGHSTSSELPPYPGTPAANNAPRVMSASSSGDGGSIDSVAKPPIDSPSPQGAPESEKNESTFV